MFSNSIHNSHPKIYENKKKILIWNLRCISYWTINRIFLRWWNIKKKPCTFALPHFTRIFQNGEHNERRKVSFESILNYILFLIELHRSSARGLNGVAFSRSPKRRKKNMWCNLVNRRDTRTTFYTIQCLIKTHHHQLMFETCRCRRAASALIGKRQKKKTNKKQREKTTKTKIVSNFNRSSFDRKFMSKYFGAEFPSLWPIALVFSLNNIKQSIIKCLILYPSGDEYRDGSINYVKVLDKFHNKTQTSLTNASILF